MQVYNCAVMTLSAPHVLTSLSWDPHPHHPPMGQKPHFSLGPEAPTPGLSHAVGRTSPVSGFCCPNLLAVFLGGPDFTLLDDCWAVSRACYCHHPCPAQIPLGGVLLVQSLPQVHSWLLDL